MNHNGWTDKAVLVTGSAGFLGSHLVEALLCNGAKVLALDQIADPWRLAGVIQDITYREVDIGDVAWDLGGEPELDAIFHLAAFSIPTAAQKDPALAYRQNVLGTANALQFAKNCSTRKFIFTSAAALYNNIPKYLPMDEKHPIDPSQSVYATTKRIGELLCEEFHKNYGLPTLYVRLFNTFGPRQSAELLIPSFIQQAQREGKITVQNERVWRDFNFVADVVDALLKAAESDYCGGPVNIGTGVEHSIGEIGRSIGDFMGVEVECLTQDTFGPTRQVCDNSFAKRILDWQPAYSFQEGLQKTLQWFSKQPALK